MSTYWLVCNPLIVVKMLVKHIHTKKTRLCMSLKIFLINFPDLVAILLRPAVFLTSCTAITQLVICAVGFSHDCSNTFEHFET